MPINRQYPNAPVVAVATLILDKDGLLLVERKNEPSKGLWSARGVVELGERIEDAVKGEVEQETGLQIEVDRPLTATDSIIKDKNDRVRFHYVMLYYLAHPTVGTPKASNDTEDAKWIPPD